MAKANGKSEIEPQEMEHELPPAEDDGFVERAAKPEIPAGAGASAPAGSELEAVKAERDALLDRLARQQAEFENTRKRGVREQQEFREYAQAETIKALLPVLDSLERALKTRTQPADLRAGVELIYRQLQDSLGKLGLRPIPARGEQFDPYLHQAVEVVEDAVPENQIVEELQRGYKFKDRLLRPSMVRVARHPEKK